MTMKQIPTRQGDVLILRTSQSFRSYAVGVVSHAGQDSFQGDEGVQRVAGEAEAVTIARRIAAPGRRIHLCDIDTRKWTEIPN